MARSIHRGRQGGTERRSSSSRVRRRDPWDRSIRRIRWRCLPEERTEGSPANQTRKRRANMAPLARTCCEKGTRPKPPSCGRPGRRRVGMPGRGSLGKGPLLAGGAWPRSTRWDTHRVSCVEVGSGTGICSAWYKMRLVPYPKPAEARPKVESRNLESVEKAVLTTWCC